MTKEEFCNDYKKELDAIDAKCASLTCSECPYAAEPFCRCNMFAEILYDAGYHKCDKNDDMPDAYDCVCQNRVKFPKRRSTKFLFVEDGSTNMERLEKLVNNAHSNIAIVVYKQGSKCPVLINIKDQ